MDDNTTTREIMLTFMEFDIKILFEEHYFSKNMFVTITDAIIKYGFIANDFDHCVYYWNNRYMLMII